MQPISLEALAEGYHRHMAQEAAHLVTAVQQQAQAGERELTLLGSFPIVACEHSLDRLREQGLASVQARCELLTPGRPDMVARLVYTW